MAKWYAAALSIGRSKAHAKTGEDWIRHPDIRAVASRTRSIMFTKRTASLVAGRKLHLQINLTVDDATKLDIALHEAMLDFLIMSRLAKRLAKELKNITKEPENE